MMQHVREPKVWPNHRSHPILGTIFYQWVLWIDGDETTRNMIRQVEYVLHPTFKESTIITDDVKGHFRIVARGWGSFYIKVIMYYETGFSEETSYFLDVKQFYKREGPLQLKKCTDTLIDDSKLLALYKDGYRDFSGITITPSNDLCLRESVLVGANFEKSSLVGLKMPGSNLAMCNMHDANLTLVDLSGANLTMCRLSNATLDGSIIYGVNKTDWIVDGVKATHVYLDSRREYRIPVGRDFGEREFASWLMTIRDLKDVVPPNAPRVFMSYSWQDEEAVLAVDQWLRNHGVKVVIDRRDFLPGSDLYDQMVETIKGVDKVVIFYSQNSRDRPYTTLERRIAQEVEIQSNSEEENKILLIYFQLDDENLPTEVSHRLSIRARGRGFEEVCQKLLDAVMERKSLA
jgi:hypothetical protein